MKRKLLIILRNVLIGLVVLYGVCAVMIEIPPVQRWITSAVQEQLTQFMGTKVEIGHITVGYPNRFIVDDLNIDDKTEKPMLKAARLSAKMEWIPLLTEGRISMHTVQLFGFHINLNRKTRDSEPNYQFILDLLAPTDTTSSKSPLNLRINSLLVRRGNLTYDVESDARTYGKFNPHHLNVTGINATINLKSFSKDSINAAIRRLDFKEQSGFVLKGLQMQLKANNEKMTLDGFDLKLPESHLRMKDVQVDFSEKEWYGIPVGRMRAEIDHRSYLTPADLTAFAPFLAHFDEPLYIKARLRTDSTLTRITGLDIHSRKREVNLQATNLMARLQRGESPYVKAELKELRANQEGIDLLWRNLNGENSQIPKELQNAGFLQFVGNISGTTDNMSAHGLLKSGIGDIQTDAYISLMPDGKLKYKGLAGSNGLELERLLGKEKKLGNVSFNLEFDGMTPQEGNPSLYLKGEVPTLQYSEYEYKNIYMDGTFNEEGFNGILALDDPNVALALNGRLGLVREVPTFNLKMQIDHFSPYNLKLTNDRAGYQYGMKLEAHIHGNNIDNVEGMVKIDSLKVIVPGDTFETKGINLLAQTTENGEKQLTMEADFMKAHLNGRYSYTTLEGSFHQIAAHYMPSLIPTNEKRKGTETKNRFDFNLKLDESKFYTYVLGIPLSIHPTATMKGYINDSTRCMEMSVNTPNFIYDGTEYEGGNLYLGNNEQEISTNFNITQHQEDGERLTLIFDAQAGADTLTTQLVWGNDTKVTNAGIIKAHAHITPRQRETEEIEADICLEKSEIIVNDTVWNVSPAQIHIRPESVEINNLDIGHEKQHLIVNGRISENPDDSLVIDLRRMAVEYILGIVQFDAVSFTGKATGRAIIGNPDGEIKAYTKLHVENFHFNDGLMGDMEIAGWWDKETGVMLDADIREKNLGRTTVKGYVSPQQKGLNLHIGAQNTNLAFLNSFVGSIFDNVKGRVSGPIHLHGPFKELLLEGNAEASAQAHVKILNTPIILQNDSIRLTDTGIIFPNVTVRDPEGNTAATTGKLSYKHFKNMGYNFRFNLDNFRFYDTNDFGNMPFYGHLYGSGMATLWGGGNQLNLNANIQTDRNSTFVYNLSTPESITDNSFVTFVDKTPRQNQDIKGLRLFQSKKEYEEKDNGQPLQVAISAAIDVTPNATVRVIMNTQSGDYVEAQGRGTINVAHTNESTDLRGTYTVEGGIYKMSMQDVIRKDFQLQEGSEVTFTGEGGDADLNLKAVHTVNSASLLDLVPDATFNNNTVKVDCIINMTGKLAAPVLDFDLDLPTVNDEERQLVRSAITTDEQMRTQIIYLLGVGKFYTFDYANTDERTSSNAMSSLLSSTLSGQLNNILSQALNMNNWNFSSNLSTGQEGWSDLEVEGILSGRMLDNRLLFNGNFGYREDQLRKSNFVGDFDVQWLLNQSGEIRVKLYNMTNDRYFAKQTLNTQGVGLIYKRDFNNWFDLFRKRKKEK